MNSKKREALEVARRFVDASTQTTGRDFYPLNCRGCPLKNIGSIHNECAILEWKKYVRCINKNNKKESEVKNGN